MTIWDWIADYYRDASDNGDEQRMLLPQYQMFGYKQRETDPKLAQTLTISDKDWVTAETRRGSVTLRAQVVTTIRPDTIFIPYHWAGRKSANRLTISAQDPISKIPEYKVCAVRIKKADAAPAYASELQPQQ